MLIPKHVPYRDRKYLDALRGMPCIVTGKIGCLEVAVDPAHIGTAGRGLKSDDFHALPLLHSEHALQHQMGEQSYWLQKFTEDKYLLQWFLKAGAEKLWRESRAND